MLLADSGYLILSYIAREDGGGSPSAYARLPRKPALLKYQGMSPLVLMGRTSMPSALSSLVAYARDSGGRILPFIVLIVAAIQPEDYAVKKRRRGEGCRGQ